MFVVKKLRELFLFMKYTDVRKEKNITKLVLALICNNTKFVRQKTSISNFPGGRERDGRERFISWILLQLPTIFSSYILYRNFNSSVRYIANNFLYNASSPKVCLT